MPIPYRVRQCCPSNSDSSCLDNSQQNPCSATNAIYGIRFRLCDCWLGPGNINYVRQTIRPVHKRLCRAVENEINKELSNVLGVARRVTGQEIVESSYEKKEGYLEQIDTFCLFNELCWMCCCHESDKTRLWNIIIWIKKIDLYNKTSSLLSCLFI